VATLYDRVQETTTTTGTGTVTLGGAVLGYFAFNAIFNVAGSVTPRIPYSLVSGSAFEVGYGTYSNTANTFSRDTILAGSAGTSPIVLAGTSNIFITGSADVLKQGLYNKQYMMARAMALP
jgi:hypothetical protein